MVQELCFRVLGIRMFFDYFFGQRLDLRTLDFRV